MQNKLKHAKKLDGSRGSSTAQTPLFFRQYTQNKVLSVTKASSLREPKEKHCPNPMFVRQSTQNKKLLNKAQYNTSLSVQQTLREPRE